MLIPPIMPKPDVVALTGGYRRTPVLQVGADIFCDTALIRTLIAGPKPAEHMVAGMADAAQAFAQDRDAMFGSMVRPRAPDAKAAARSYVLDRS